MILVKNVKNRTDLYSFYTRRIRRIIPLTLFFCILTLLLGFIFMLPDDYENLSQSVIATLSFSNNILLYLTTQDYWSTINEYKPLMHTWSLGIEEQFYLLFPLICLVVRNKKLLLITVSTLSIISIILYLLPFENSSKFYFLQFRFFELAIGCIVGIAIGQDKQIRLYKPLVLLAILAILFLGPHIGIIAENALILICILTAMLCADISQEKFSSLVLSNPVMVTLGKISFSMYLWHQVILAFVKYTLTVELNNLHYTIIFILITILSFISYKIIEQPFRNPTVISNRRLFYVLGSFTLGSIVISTNIYLSAGVVRDVPELNITKGAGFHKMHSSYTERVKKRLAMFNPEQTTKILVIGDSFASDWTNVLLEYDTSYRFDIVRTNTSINNKSLLEQADFIFVTRKINLENIDIFKELELFEKSNYDSKLWCVGTKNFGFNNGLFYNSKSVDYCAQTTPLEEGIIKTNQKLHTIVRDRFINLSSYFSEENQEVKVFTPECKFISYDCRHFTQAGAQYAVKLLSNDLAKIFNENNNTMN